MQGWVLREEGAAFEMYRKGKRERRRIKRRTDKEKC